MKTVSLQVLFVLRVLWLGTLTEGQPKASLKCSTECGHFTSKIPEKRIKSYRRTEPQCTKQGIIFITQKSLEICADPGEDWVKKVIWKLDQRKASAASPLPHAATSAAVPEDSGIFHRHVGLKVTASSQATAPTSTFQGAGTTVSEGINAPPLRTEVSSKPTPAMQYITQFSTGSSPVVWEIAAHSEISSEANRDSTKAIAHSTTYAAGMVPNQSIPYSMALVHGFENSVGSTEEPIEYTANATADVPDMTSPSLNSDPVSVTEASDHSVDSTGESLGPKSARATTADIASRHFNSDLPSILGSTEITTTPTTPFPAVPPDATSVSTLNPTTVINEGFSAHTNKVFGSWTDAFDTGTSEHSSPLGKQDLPDTSAFTSQTFSGQARAQLTTKKPNEPPFPIFLSRSQMHFVILASLIGGLIACSAAAVWLYKKLGIKKEAMPMETIQGLLYQQEGHQASVYPVGVI
ncbi:fractalkine [Dromaius novaehollandiae]|uniref:C-X3-C motif chemokine ligand 1 n=1 Tax=Dromaius novaehollandiae TaxID=8790 RepID=A0A8C4K820_DRONO|nr:fractalkine [Dromaius novaehollandiae]